MKRVWLGFLALLVFTEPSFAQSTVTWPTFVAALGAATSLAGTELISGVQSAAGVKITPAQILTYVLANGAATGTITSSSTAQCAVFSASTTIAGTTNCTVTGGALTLGTNTTTLGSLKMFGSTSGDVTVKPAAIAGTATVFQLPATNGSNTNVLQTDGNGVTSWVPAAVTPTLPWTTATAPAVGTGAVLTLPTYTSLVSGLTITGDWNNAGNFPGFVTINPNPVTSAGAGSSLFEVQNAGTSVFQIKRDGVVNLVANIVNPQISWANSSIVAVANDMYINSFSTTLHFGTQDSGAAPALNFAIQNTQAGTADTAGGAWTIKGSQGTGTGAGGSIIFQTANASTTGSTQNALATILTLAPGQTSATGPSISMAGVLISTGTAPTVSASGGTCAVTSPSTGGSSAFEVTTTGACATTNTITVTFLKAATNHYVCDAHDVTTVADASSMVQIAAGESTTTAVFQTNTVASADHIRFKCMAF